MTQHSSNPYSMSAVEIQHDTNTAPLQYEGSAEESSGSITNMFGVAIRFTIATTILLGVLYPLAVTGLAQLMMRDKADGQLLSRDGKVIGSKLIGQSFVSDAYFHGRPSAAGNGYDGTSSGSSNLGPTSKKLIDRINNDVAVNEKLSPNVPVPIDLVTMSGSGLDPDISPASAFYQVPRVAAVRHLPEDTLRAMVRSHIQHRQFGVLGEPRVNVLELNLALDGLSKAR